MYNGIINVYKETGFTSHDVVAKLRGILQQKKIGHTGTLDPDAVGVLPVCLGKGTKLCDMLTGKNKEYRAEFLLGKVTDTQDISGKIISEKEVNVTEDEVKEIIYSFEGNYEQIPPMYSAIKVDGKKLYELARAGKEIERKARPVQITHIEIEKLELPYAQIKVECSKGTYIRTLCHDIGQKLVCGAVMTALKRTRVGEFKYEDAVTLSQIEEAVKAGTIETKILAVEAFFTDYPCVIIEKQFQKLIDNGNPFYAEMVIDKKRFDDDSQVRVYNEENIFYGIFRYSAKEDKYKPVKMFVER